MNWHDAENMLSGATPRPRAPDQLCPGLHLANSHQNMHVSFLFYHCIRIICHISPLFLQLSVTTSASLWIFPGSVCLWLQLRWERRARTGFFNRLKYVLEHFVIHQILNLKTCSHSIKSELCPAGLPDIVVDGVLQGFYPRDIRVSFTAPILTEPDPASSIEAWNDSL